MNYTITNCPYGKCDSCTAVAGKVCPSYKGEKIIKAGEQKMPVIMKIVFIVTGIAGLVKGILSIVHQP